MDGTSDAFYPARSEGRREREGEMKGWSRGQKNRDDRRDRLAVKGGIKECHKDCLCARLLMFLHAVAISQQSPTFYMLRMNLFYPCGLCPPLLNPFSLSLCLSPPPLPPSPRVQCAPVARHSCLIGLLNEEWVVFGRILVGKTLQKWWENRE